MKFFIEHFKPEMEDGSPAIYGPEDEEVISKMDSQLVWTEVQRDSTVITNGFLSAEKDPEVNGYYLCKNPCTEVPHSQNIFTEIYVECEPCEALGEVDDEECETCEGQGFTYRYLNEILKGL